MLFNMVDTTQIYSSLTKESVKIVEDRVEVVSKKGISQLLPKIIVR